MAISEFIVKEYENLPLAHEFILKHHLWTLCLKREVLCTDNERYSLPNDGTVGKVAVGMQRKKRKKSQKKVGPRRGADKDGEETNGGDIGEGNQLKEREVEGIQKHGSREEGRERVAGKLSNGKEENIQVIEVIEELSEAAREEHMEKKKMKLNNGVSDEAIIEQFDKASETIEVHQLGMVTKQNVPPPEKTEVFEKELELEEVPKQQQQDKAELNEEITTIPPSDPNSDGQRFKTAELKGLSVRNQQRGNALQPRKLRSHNSHSVELASTVTIGKRSLISQQTEHQGKEKQCRLRHSKRKRDMEKNSEVEFPLVVRHHGNELSLKRCLAKGRHPETRSERKAMADLLPPSDVELGDQNEQQKKELSPSRQQLQNQSLHQFPQRVLSHYKESSVFGSMTPTLTLSCLPSEPQNKQQEETWHQVLGKRQGRPPKPEGDVDSQAALYLPLQHNEDEQQPTKRGRGRPPKPKLNADTAVIVCRPIETKTEGACKGRGRPPKPKRGQGRPPKPKPNSDTAVVVYRPLDAKTEGASLKRKGQGRPPKPKPNSGTNMVVCAPPDVLPRRGRGRPPKTKTDMDLNAATSLSLSLLPQEDNEPPAPLERRGRGRPRKPKKPSSETAMVVFKSSDSLSKKGQGQLPYKGRGRPPKAKKSGGVTMASFSNLCFRRKQKMKASS